MMTGKFKKTRLGMAVTKLLEYGVLSVFFALFAGGVGIVGQAPDTFFEIIRFIVISLVLYISVICVCGSLLSLIFEVVSKEFE